MRHAAIVFCLLLLPTLSLAQRQTSSIQLYDNFNTSWLDPTKWAAIPTCSATPFLDTTASINLVDCLRAIQGHKLRLMVKAYGHIDSDTDRQLGPSELYFANPNNVHTIHATFRIARTESTACPTNGTDSFGQVMAGGNYFNAGTGDPKDDMTAIILIQHMATDAPGIANAGAALFSQNGGFGWVDLGSHDVGEVLKMSISWNQTSHLFTFSLTGSSGIHSGQLSYVVSDILPPTAPMKLLAARAFVPNCSSQLTSAHMDVVFHEVFTD